MEITKVHGSTEVFVNEILKISANFVSEALKKQSNRTKQLVKWSQKPILSHSLGSGFLNWNEKLDNLQTIKHLKVLDYESLQKIHNKRILIVNAPTGAGKSIGVNLNFLKVIIFFRCQFFCVITVLQQIKEKPLLLCRLEMQQRMCLRILLQFLINN